MSTPRSARETRLIRQWQIVRALQGASRGLTRMQLMDDLEISKSTLHRELNTLLEAGVPLTSERVNGTSRWRLLGEAELPPLGLTAMQLAALRLVRHQLEPLSGSELVAALDAGLAKLQQRRADLPVHLGSAAPPRSAILAAVEDAVQRGRRLRIEYRAVARAGKPEQVTIEPLLLNLAHGVPYLRGYCIEREDLRTYKLARIGACDVTQEPAKRHASPDVAKEFARSVKAWTGDLVQVRVLLSPRVAWLAPEYPLVSDQAIALGSDGSAVITAKVAGTTEALRWVLAWGVEAEALEPPELRRAVQREVEGAAARYRRAKPVMPAPRTTSPRQAGTGGG